LAGMHVLEHSLGVIKALIHTIVSCRVTGREF
jgi:hypothetical protein